MRREIRFVPRGVRPAVRSLQRNASGGRRRSSARIFYYAASLQHLSQTNVIGGVLPLRAASGQFDGVIALTLDVSWFDVLLHTRPIPEGAVIAVSTRPAR
jgi:hypothetical protein